MNIIVCEIPLAGISGEFSKIIEEKDGVSALIYSEEISDYTPLNRVKETWQAWAVGYEDRTDAWMTADGMALCVRGGLVGPNDVGV
jgi:hypothetical protein